MILVDWQISDYVDSGKIGIEPFNKKQINPNSYDMCLGNSFIIPYINDFILDPYDNESFGEEVISSEIVLYPCKFILAETMETLTLPDDIVGCIEGKSSIARMGQEIHMTGGWIDAGFSGTITLEILNNLDRPFKFYAGMPIAQIVFHKTQSCDTPYGRRTSSKYQGQKGATTSMYYKNEKL